MEWWQISHSTRKVSGLKGPNATTPDPVKIVADDGVCDRLVGGVPDSSGLYAKGRRPCVQHFPWLTQVLQKPQSPPLQRLHRQ
jgi:hypothetical protein